MATVAEPRRRLSFGRRPLIIIGVLILLGLIAGALFLRNQAATDTTALPPGWDTATAQVGAIEATVDATGDVEAVKQANLNFAANGTVTTVLVKPGDRVQAGQPLARIDDTDLQLSLEKARADLKQSQADYQALLEGATPEEIAEAQARVARSQSQYQRTASSVTQADLDAARADLEKAQARLARLEGGPEEKDLIEADATAQRAQSTLEESRSQLASAKERARLDMETAANELRDRQDEYSQVYWDNRETERALGRRGQELPQADKDAEAAALRAVQVAEATLAQRRIAYEEAQKEEITTLQQREADLREAQANLEDVRAGTRSEDLAEARAEVQRAQANLAELTGAQRSSDLAAEQASVAEAQAQLEKLLADPSASELAKADAAVARSETAVKEAERDLERATLLAPFDATVTRVNLQEGERTDSLGSSSDSQTSSSAQIAIADLRGLEINVPVDELDVAQIEDNQQVRITLDALPDAEIMGTVTNIAPLADKSDQGTTTYEVTVAIDTGDSAVRPGMTAVVEIVTRRKEEVVLVPRRAVQVENGQSYVLIPAEGQPDPQTSTPASEQREVTLGLSDNQFIEITDGLQGGETVLVRDVVSTFNPMGR